LGPLCGPNSSSYKSAEKAFQLPQSLPITPARISGHPEQQRLAIEDQESEINFWRACMNSWFANISVNLKLGLGFGLVLVLTGLLALTGWTSLGSLIDRSNWMGDIGQLNKDLTDLRIARLQYMIANGDDTAAANTQAKLDAFSKQQAYLASTFKSPENVKLLNELGETISAYKLSLNKMRQGYDATRSARDDGQLGHPRRPGHGHPQPGSDGTPRGRQRAPGPVSADQQGPPATAAGAHRCARLHRRQHAANEQAALRQLDAALADIDNLKRQLPAEDARLQQFERSVLAYRDAVRQFRDAVANITTSRAEMTVQGADIVKRSDALYQIQLERRDIESAQARSLQAIATLLALLVGVLAAVLITRQITARCAKPCGRGAHRRRRPYPAHARHPPRRAGRAATRHRAHGHHPARTDQRHPRRRHPDRQRRRRAVGRDRTDQRRRQQPEGRDRPGGHRHARNGRHRAGSGAQRRASLHAAPMPTAKPAAATRWWARRSARSNAWPRKCTAPPKP
jgi:hypothetical protein